MPNLVKAGMALCETSMSVSEVLSFAPMLSNDITIETMVVPGDEDNAVGGIYDGAWVWRYDLAAAADRMHLFIYGEVPETTASSKKKQESQTTTKSSKSSSSRNKEQRLFKRRFKKAKVPPRHRLSTAAAIINPKPRQNRRQPPRQP